MKIDNYALTMHQTCPAKFELGMLQHWRPRMKAAALGFGTSFHAGLAAWYKTGEVTKALLAIRESWDPESPMDDYRTLERCAATMLEYVKIYPVENFRILEVEVPFLLPLGLCTDDGEAIEYGGIFDMLVEFGGNVYVMEHKTTSQMGPLYFNQYKPNNQVTGYVWGAAALSGHRVAGAIINAICVTKTSAPRFQRQITTRTPEEIARWRVDVQSECNNIKRHERDGHFPYRTTSCMQYGMCAYHSVHVLSNPAEQRVMLEQQYVQQRWDFEARDENA